MSSSETFAIKPHSLAVTDWPIRPSPWIASAVALLALGALLAVLASGLHWGIRLLLSVFMVAYAIVRLSHLLRPHWKALALEQGEPTLIDHDGCRYRLRLEGRPFVSPLYIGFSGRLANNERRCCSVGVFYGQLAGEDFRRLAAGLRITEES